MTNIFPFSHDTLMNLNIILSGVHLILSVIILILIFKEIQLHYWVLPSFLVFSSIICILILLYSFDCKNKKM
jgi:hypothetical protein